MKLMKERAREALGKASRKESLRQTNMEKSKKVSKENNLVTIATLRAREERISNNKRKGLGNENKEKTKVAAALRSASNKKQELKMVKKETKKQ